MDRTFVGLPADDAERAGHGSHRGQGLYHVRSRGPAPTTAFIATHYSVDFGEHYLADPLARRGFGFLGWNTRFRGNDAYFSLDRALADIALGVAWLRDQGVERLVLLGNSGGGSLMAAYQAQAEGAGAPPGDLYVSLAAHPGRPQVLTAWMDAAVTDESDPTRTDPALDIFNPDHGPPYTPEFVARYRAAQVARNHRITAWAKQELQRLRAAGLKDRVFSVQRTWADPRMLDPSLDPSERPTPACYLGDPARANRGVLGIAIMNTIRGWLEMWSLDDSRCAGAEHLAKVTVPALVVQATMDTGVFPADAVEIFAALGSQDKQLIEARGDHYFQAPAAARETLADLLAGWVEPR